MKIIAAQILNTGNQILVLVFLFFFSSEFGKKSVYLLQAGSRRMAFRNDSGFHKN